jgi:hypothetical protein
MLFFTNRILGQSLVVLFNNDFNFVRSLLNCKGETNLGQFWFNFFDQIPKKPCFKNTPFLIQIPFETFFYKISSGSWRALATATSSVS